MADKTTKIPDSAPCGSSHPPSLISISAPTLVLWSLILAYILFFSAYSLQRHATFNTFAADLSYIDQPMWNTLHGRFLERTLDDRQVSRVAEHLEPIIVPISFVFYLWDDVRAILIVQTVALALGAVPVYWIARAQISNGKYQISNIKSELLPITFAFVYLMFPALQAANVADFHADPFVVTPLLFAFWYATQRRYGLMWVWAALAMLVKENLPTLTFMLGLYLLLGRGSGILNPRRLHGLALVFLSLAWFYVATFLIVAPLACQVYGTPGPIYLVSRYPEFGGGMSGLLRGLLARPGDTLALLREPDRLRYLVGLFASVGWLALLAPEYLLLGLPVLVANVFSNFPGQYSGEQHYSAPLVPVFIIAAIYGCRRVIMGLNRISDDRSRVSRFINFSLLTRHPYIIILVWLLAWTLGYHYMRGWTPLARDFDWPRVTPHHRLLARFAAQIPPRAALSTTPPLHPHLAHREKIYVYSTIADADFVLLDVSGRTDAHPNDVRATFDSLLGSGEFGVVDAADGYLLLSRGAGGAGEEPVLPDAFFDFARAPDVEPEYPALLEFENGLRFLGYDVVDDPKWRQTYLRLYWQTLTPLPDDLRLWPFFFDPTGLLIEDTSQRPMVAPLWFPPASWQPGETVLTETLPWDLGARFFLGLAVLEGTAGADPATAFADPAKRLSITSAAPGLTLFHADSWAQLGAFARDGSYLVPTTDHPALLPVDVAFEEGIHLIGYQVANLPDQFLTVLEWQAVAPISRDYTVFVHLVTSDGRVVAQSDAQPTWVVPWPTNRWSPEGRVLDGHHLSLPSNLSPGRYRVQVGLYYWETLERLPVLNQAKQPVGDHIVLEEIEIRP